MNVAVSTRNLTKHFGDFCAVDHVNLNVECGTFYGFLGPNGAGKSTTIKMLTGLLRPTDGDIRVLEMDPLNASDATAIKQRIGVVPENLALFDNVTAHEYLMFVGRMYGVSVETIRDRSAELLALLDLVDVGKKLTLEYSHGMRKKLAMAAALLPNPDLLFLDEPFEGVDAVTSSVIRRTLNAYVSRGSTVFLTSHVLEIVERLCTHVGIIADGKLVEQAVLDDIRKGGSLEDRFIAKVGHDESIQHNLSWLEENGT